MKSSPSTSLYTLGRGIITLGPWVGTAPPEIADMNDVGNVVDFSVEVTESLLEHFSRRTGLKTKDKVVILETGYTASFTLDEVSAANLALYVKGTLEGNVIHAATATLAEYALTFQSDNPDGEGENQKWELWRCNISPDGAAALLGDDWLQLKFKATGLADAANHSESPLFDVTVITTTTSA